MNPVCDGMVVSRWSKYREIGDFELRGLVPGKILVFDGAMGTMLQRAGIKQADTVPELLCLTDPDLIRDIHRQYVQAGCDVITTNTFGANSHKLAGEASVEEVYGAAVTCARDAGARFVAADIGPSGMLMEPFGELTFETAYELFSEQAHAAAKAGADLIIIETMADLLEMKACVLACKEAGDLPVVATMTFNESGRTLMGATPEACAVALSGLGVTAAGLNCSLGPVEIAPFVEETIEYASVPVVVQPNAGLPVVENGEAVYKIDVHEFVESCRSFLEGGVQIIGSCCGTSPEYTAALRGLADSSSVPTRTSDLVEWICSPSRIARFDEHMPGSAFPLNNEGASDADAVLDAAYEASADVSEVVALWVDGYALGELADIVRSIQMACDKPMMFVGADARHVETALRAYAGRPACCVMLDDGELMWTITEHYGAAGILCDGVMMDIRERAM